MKKNIITAIALLSLGLASCTNQAEETLTLSGLNPTDFKTDSTALYTLTNDKGMEVCLTNFGGRIVSIMVPDKDGNMQDVCLGCASVADYEKYGAEGCNFGALIGRYGNRIAKGKFSLDGNDYQLICNNNGNSLHGGGEIAFHNRIWQADSIDGHTLAFTTTSPDGEDGYPGNLEVKVVYTLTEDNALEISYEATTDKPTVINLTNHCYFNLSGDPSKDALSQVLYLDADQFTAVDENVAVTGEVLPVEGTPFDFRQENVIGERINGDHAQLINGKGYDHNWILNVPGDIKHCFGTLVCETTGIRMEMFTDQPGVQFYAGNFIDGKVIGKKGIAYPRRSGLCFETQHFPDSPNHPEWPSTTLRPGETYTTTTIYRFSVVESAE